MLSQPNLPVLRLQLSFRALDDIEDLPEFRGAFWRGQFGRALKRLADPALADKASWAGAVATRHTGNIARTALYQEIFAPDASAGPQHLRPLAPFVVDAPSGPGRLKAGEHEMIGLTLIGARAASALPAILAAFAWAAEQGLGGANDHGHRGRAQLVDAVVAWREPGAICSVLDRDGIVTNVPAMPPGVPPCPPAVTVHLGTPLRLVRGGQPLAPDDLIAGDLLDALVRRISSLQRSHATPVAADFGALLGLCRQVRQQAAELDFIDRHRWSGKQQQEIAMGGIIGHFRLPLAGFEPLWPWLWLGQWVHVGKGAVMGLGSIRLTA